MYDEIQVQVGAVRFACRRMNTQRVQALHQSIEQARQLPARFDWDRKAAAHAEIFNLLADAAGDSSRRLALNSGVGLAHYLMMTAGPVADGVVDRSRRRVLACLQAGDAEGAADEMERELRLLHFLSRLARPRPAGDDIMVNEALA